MTHEVIKAKMGRPSRYRLAYVKMAKRVAKLGRPARNGSHLRNQIVGFA
jgi:hypothetical protein